jgi:hypothetical protein
MNTLLNEQGLLKALIDGKTDKYESEDMDNAEDVAIAQDLHTKSILADEVRVLIDKRIPYKKYLPFSADHTPEWDIYEAALQAVLKVIENKE